MLDYRLRLDGALDEIWEPQWRLSVQLFPAEKALLRSKTVRRLHFIRHGGASFINTHHTYSRLQHTLGVFALAAHFDPENRALRAAALLHDVGHAPFSHTLDSIEGVNHHQWTRQIVFSEEIGNILLSENLDPDQIFEYIDGTRSSLLRNSDGTLHSDHLDSWVRSASTGGYLPVSTRQILDGISYLNGSLRFTLSIGKLVAELIIEEARMHLSHANIGVNAILRKLVLRLISEGKLEVAALPTMTDAHIEHLLRSEECTCEEYERLLTESWRIRVTREEPPVPSEITNLRKLYLAMPLIGREPITDITRDMMKTVRELEQMLGMYYVWWDSDR